MDFSKGKFTEAELEAAIIALFVEQGYEHVHGDKLHRKFENTLLENDLRAYLTAQYAAAGLSETEIGKIISRLSLIPSSPLYAGNREAFWLVTEGFDFGRDDPVAISVHVNFIDLEHPENNTFKVVNQFSVRGERLCRPDMLLFINGIPVAIFEFKTTIEENKTIYDAWEQIHKRYCRDIAKLMKYCFLSCITDGANTKLASIFTPYEYYYSWNKASDDEKVSNGISALFTMIHGAFTKDRVTAILRDYVYYPDESKNEKAIVTRYPQFFAANKMLSSIKQHMRTAGDYWLPLPTGVRDGKGGTYSGATGCGKTYIMLFLSRLLALRERDVFNNPTIVIIEDRKDLQAALGDSQSGGVFVTTIQKFCESTGLLSDRTNIICISDEAHRTQTNTASKLKVTDEGVSTTYGFAKYLRDSFPNATYCGFTGTPVDETIAVFGEIVDRYTMKESSDDGITVRIAYEPRLARVILSDDAAKEIQKYYDQCTKEGAMPAQIEKSKKAMSAMKNVLGHPDRLKRLAMDIADHYDALCNEKPAIMQKAMIVCADRTLAWRLYKEIITVRPEWECEKIKLVATQGANDERELFDLCGTKEYRQKLDKQFKSNESNFKIAVVVDMWITGFDVPSLAVMYIDKPLQKHTLIQTISRVNRVFEGKDKGLVVDYIGIQEDMLAAIKQYGDEQDSPIDELGISLEVTRNHLSLIDNLMHGFNAVLFYHGVPQERLICLNNAVEFVQLKKEMETRFMDLSRKLKAAYAICFPSGALTDNEIAKSQFYLAIRSIIYKQTKGDAPDAEVMNRVVEKMVQEAISCSNIENIVDADKPEDIFGGYYSQPIKNFR